MYLSIDSDFILKLSSIKRNFFFNKSVGSSLKSFVHTKYNELFKIQLNINQTIILLCNCGGKEIFGQSTAVQTGNQCQIEILIQPTVRMTIMDK